jgi:hypothetical protein
MCRTQVKQTNKKNRSKQMEILNVRSYVKARLEYGIDLFCTHINSLNETRAEEVKTIYPGLTDSKGNLSADFLRKAIDFKIKEIENSIPSAVEHVKNDFKHIDSKEKDKYIEAVHSATLDRVKIIRFQRAVKVLNELDNYPDFAFLKERIDNYKTVCIKDATDDFAEDLNSGPGM